MIFLPIWFLIAVVCSTLIYSKTVFIQYAGFALDTQGNLYLGKRDAIEVLDQSGDPIRTIDPKTGRGYFFTIEDEQLLVLTGTHTYTMDLDGNILESEERNADSPALRQEMKSRFTDADGKRYSMEFSGFFRTCIYQYDGESKTLIYEMPLFDYCIRLAVLLEVVSFIAVLPFMIRAWRKRADPERKQLPIPPVRGC